MAYEEEVVPEISNVPSDSPANGQATDMKPAPRSGQLPPRTALQESLSVCLVGLGGIVAGALNYGGEQLCDSAIFFGFWHGLALWGMITIGVGLTFRGRWKTAAAAGLVTQVCLVLGYYGTGYFVMGSLATGKVIQYAAFGLLAGPVYGAFAALLRDAHGRVRAIASSLVAAPWIIDGIHSLDPQLIANLHTPIIVIGSVLILIGAALVWLLNRSPRDFLRAGVATALVVGAIMTVQWLPSLL